LQNDAIFLDPFYILIYLKFDALFSLFFSSSFFKVGIYRFIYFYLYYFSFDSLMRTIIIVDFDPYSYINNLLFNLFEKCIYAVYIDSLNFNIGPSVFWLNYIFNETSLYILIIYHFISGFL